MRIFINIALIHLNRLAFYHGTVYNTNMQAPNIVLDTNVVVSALRSNKGASYLLFRLVGTDKLTLNLSVPLVIEYERALLDPKLEIPFKSDEITMIINYICASSRHHEIYFLWRPFLPDPGDDMLLELAVASSSDYIVTFNKRDFRGINRFGIKLKTPIEFLREIGVLK